MNILVVDDEINIRKTLSICLETEGYRVVAVSNFEDALSEASRESFGIAFVDLRLGAADGLDLIPDLLATTPWIRIIVITAYATVESAVEAMKRGATDYLPKPFTPAQVKLAVRKALDMLALEQKIVSLKEDLGRSRPETDFSSSSLAMNRAVELARSAAPSDATLLLRGETGTGKSVLAKAIHSWSSRAARPFSVLSCPSLSPELLESELFGHVKGAFTGAVRDNPGRISACNGGTIFLDEIGDLPLSLQPKLLRFVQDKEYERVGDYVTRHADVRILAATSMDLEESVRQGRFREDLYYRLNVIQIEIPPLRERPDDAIALAEHLLLFFGRACHRSVSGFTDEVLHLFRSYRWPGNVRELRNVVERAVILCRGKRIGGEDLPDNLRPSQNPTVQIGDPVSLEQIEEAHIRRILAGTRSLQEAADILGIDQATLWRRRKQYGI
ncbi:Two-component response regulator AlgB [Syntrophus gentianae]|uniref:Two-component response regulator AlgB n=1 Tax=Syntrophus gentianae TaxID=43775 RepID=A0A1H7VNI9_9BACT|nr:sigma-54 dependent transcriptional regulator [Syntrophus gentianae]SEM10811.1 Two-component response regulator AlgB [Syntrophus gentianae]